MKQLPAMLACALLLSLGACGSGSHAKQDQQADKAPKKSVFDPYVQDVNKAKQVQGKLDAAQQKANQQLQQAQAASTTNAAQSAQPPSD